MVRISASPTIHHIHNEFDEFGLLLGLPRLLGEDNASYKLRLSDVMVHRANSTYMGLIYGITRELGLKIFKALTIECLTDLNGDMLLPNPAVEFKDVSCILYSDYANNDILISFDRFEIDDGSWSLNELISNINNTGYFSATLGKNLTGDERSMTIYRQSSVEIIPTEDIARGGPQVKLANNHLIENSVAVTSFNLTNRVANEIDLIEPGDYYIDLLTGYVRSTVVPGDGSLIRYKCLHQVQDFWASPVIIHDIQAEGFQSKLFNELESGVYGIPTVYGASIINELLSLYPTSWGY